MSRSLDAACAQFEQCIIADMLRSAGIGKSIALPDGDAGAGAGEDASVSPLDAGTDAASQLFVQALSGALERAGGIGLQRALRRALADNRA